MSEPTHNKKDDDRKQEAAVQIPLTDLIKVRRAKVAEMRKAGIDPYPYRYERTHVVSEELSAFDDLAEK